jgi:hypothetical protein
LEKARRPLQAVGDTGEIYFCAVARPARVNGIIINRVRQPDAISSVGLRNEYLKPVLFGAAPGHLSTIAQGIWSDGSKIDGCIHDTNMTTTMFGMSHDFVGFNFFGGMFGGLNGVGFMHNGVSPSGKILVGLFMDTTLNRARAYILQDGVAMPFDYPGAALTQAWDVNAKGQWAFTATRPAEFTAFCALLRANSHRSMSRMRR